MEKASNSLGLRHRRSPHSSQRTAAQTLYDLAKRVANRYRYPRPLIPLTDRKDTSSTVYFLTPDEERPSGGVQVTYRHVDILNEAGIDAVVLHQRKGFRCTWFENATRVTDIRSSSVGPNDFLVVSGLDVDLMTAMPGRLRYIVLNQGAHATWTRQADIVAQHYAKSSDMLGVVTVSNHSMQMLQYAYPNRAIYRVYNSIDSELFHPSEDRAPRRISYFPRRGSQEAAQVLQLLQSRGLLGNWEVVPLDGLDQDSFAAGLRSSRITLNLSYQEGFGLPAAEAMACGSYVIGFHAFGGQEFMKPEFSFPVEAGDVLAVAKAFEHVIAADTLDEDWCRERGKRASDFVLREYNQQKERDSVRIAYSALLADGQARTAT